MPTRDTVGDFPGLCITSLFYALDSTILSTALPTIAADLNSSSLYIWIVNAYIITFTAVQQLYGQCAHIFGRKKSLLVAISLFLLGSGICGGAHNTNMVIGGRAVQGLGGGGLSIIPGMVVCDVVPLRERAKHTGVVYGAFALGTFIGPVVGGSMVDHIGWRWVFWLNLLIAGLALVLVMVFMQAKHGRSGSTLTQLARIDYVGNALLMGAVTSILLALSGTGSLDLWNSWRKWLPLLLGLLGLPLFVFFEGSPFYSQPTTPLRIFTNTVSALDFLLTFLHGTPVLGELFLTSVFPSSLLATPQQSGINTLAAAIPAVPFGNLGGSMISRTGHYRLNQIIGLHFL
ncbi:hypothetical protein G7Y89_g2121 [Cudoniella acicularis]|uniref:Major facilitator superfamily (MFS) profile domain-containing protein n=1 Tax=Cudoniella acicularis TaxID=354080 RepID=A0A8H4W9M2_9HELO|nr:hypothetical protein G7Y89_g2121 [Cudoniella acicularis]